MEFNHLINRYLIRDPESRKRNLHIRTYAVVPLNEECGLIEWIPNLIGLRYVLSGIYKEKGILTSIPDLRRMIPTIKDSLAKKKEIFVNGILLYSPLINYFFNWFCFKLLLMCSIAAQASSRFQSMAVVNFSWSPGLVPGQTQICAYVGRDVHGRLCCRFRRPPWREYFVRFRMRRRGPCRF